MQNEALTAGIRTLMGMVMTAGHSTFVGFLVCCIIYEYMRWLIASMDLDQDGDIDDDDLKEALQTFCRVAALRPFLYASYKIGVAARNASDAVTKFTNRAINRVTRMLYLDRLF